MASPSSISRWISQNVWMPDEELAKKDDDLKLPHHSGSNWQAARAPRRRALLRYAVYAIAAICLLFLVRRISYSREEDIVRPYSQYRDSQSAKGVPTQLTAPKTTPKVPAAKLSPDDATEPNSQETAETPRNYRGTIKFNSLAASLRQLSSIRVGRGATSVMFAASNLQSAATILPMACERAESQKDHVFFALYGDSSIKLDELFKLNGIDGACKIMSIDARSDQSRQLSTPRLALAAARATYFIARYVNPVAVVVDASSTEDRPFLDGLRDEISGMAKTTLIELPARAHDRLSWIAHLDATALAEWNNVHFDIVIHAPPTGTGNIKRLLRSLAAADLSGHTVPHVTVELPPTLDISLERFLYTFHWPRRRLAGPSTNMLTLRHRVEHEKPGATQSTVRLLESIWPQNPAKNHVLILSPHTEVSPQFFHYVKYALLQRHHSGVASEEDPYRLLFGISFAVPKTNLHNTKPFVAPPSNAAAKSDASFVWQAPSSDAMLVFGDKWVELHGYVSQSLAVQKAGTGVPTLTQSQDVAQDKPAWLESMLQLSRLRSYYTVYPSKATADAIIGVYADLPDVPAGRDKSEAEVRLDTERGSNFDSGSQVGMLNTLPHGGLLTSLGKMPALSWEGEHSNIKDIIQDGHKQTADFRRQIGKCADPTAIVNRDRFAKDLFCAVAET